jgi:hypothetical protein
MVAMTSTVLQSQVERERPSELAKKLSEPETCRLLGYDCGLLAWSDGIASRDTILSAFFFEKLAKQPGPVPHHQFQQHHGPFRRHH